MGKMSNSSEAGADATVDAGVICTEGSMRSELSMIVPTHTSVQEESGLLLSMY